MRVRANCYNYRVLIRQGNRTVLHRYFKTMKDIIESLKGQYKPSYIRARCSQTKDNVMLEGLNVIRMKPIWLEDPTNF